MAKLNPVAEKFILHWGEMGTKWGINRTVAQIHALLFVTQEPINAEQITEFLGVARSNVSTSLKELQNWGIVRTVHVLGDRRDHFESEKDVWELFRVVLDERKKREIDPTLRVLRECVEEAEKGGKGDAHLKTQLKSLHDFFDTMSTWYKDVTSMPNKAVVKFVKLGTKIRKMFGAAS